MTISSIASSNCARSASVMGSPFIGSEVVELPFSDVCGTPPNPTAEAR